ncbi:Nitrogen assimilation transcription factor [Lasiodiplodia theobromae]|uniref:Nitrogen assimilation transcription factor n=1 Tax=Lasiodiplodia theobromae TaxID=45133 RepID=UPI0015C3ABFE|nr:Nitrogen assimilation transcription factor [Lasiodiplodia theobromae]KAF4541580.1 Nitrogen assimilation transcription factor [Lasiodiplodia theobromae]
MITDLGCHLDIPHSASDAELTAIDMEIRRRVYWGAYVGDKFQSLFLGRPPAMLESAGKVSREYLDSYEELEMWTPYVDPLVESSDATVPAYPGRPSYALSTFRSLLQLCDIAARIIDAFYSINSAEISQDALLETRHDVREQLSQWKNNLSLWLKYDPSTQPTPPPHQVTPHTTYWTLIILTEQAFLNRGRFNFTLDEGCQEEARQRCLEAALQTWRLVEAYRDAFTLRRAQYGISYATYCAALVILQHTDKEYIGCLRFFWHALVEYQRGCNYGLKRPLRLLKSLMDRLETVMQEHNTEEGEVADWQNLDEFQMDPTSAFDLESFDMAAVDPLGGPSLGATSTDGPSAHNNPIFDITDDMIYGFYM